LKYTVEMGSGATIYASSFIKIGSAIQNLMRDSQTHRQRGDLISLLLFFQNKESRLKIPEGGQMPGLSSCPFLEAPMS
jgi:hypothetical protein